MSRIKHRRCAGPKCSIPCDEDIQARVRARDRPVNFPGAADTIAFANNFWIGRAFLRFGVECRGESSDADETPQGRNEQDTTDEEIEKIIFTTY